MNTYAKKGGYYLKGPSKELFVPENNLDMVSKLKNNNFIVFDTETTGFAPNIIYGKIIEIGAVKIINGEIVDRFSTFINPGKIYGKQQKIPKKIVEVTSITDDDVKDAPEIYEVMKNFNNFIGNDSVLVAHNAKFDIRFLNFWLNEQCKFHEADSYICTMELDKILFPDAENHKLCSCIERFGIKNEHAHRAVDDAEATAKLFLKQREEILPYLDNIDYNFTNQKINVDMKKIKIRSLGDWKKPANKTHDELDRLYLNLYYSQDQVYGSVYYDRILKQWHNKDFPEKYELDFVELTQMVESIRKEGLN